MKINNAKTATFFGFHRILGVLLAIVASLSIAHAANANASAGVKKNSFTIAWSIYAGWMPWGYAGDKGIVDKWAKKYGLEINIVQVNDYVSSIEQYSAAKFDGCVMTNMDAMTMPAASGVDSTALIIGDYSNGNDALVLKNSEELKDLKGRNVHLVEYSVSHYLLLRALEKNGMSTQDVKLVNTSDADIIGAIKKPSVNAAAVWNPQLSFIVGAPNLRKVFTSKEIPGEIIDMLVVNTNVLKENPNLGKALVGAWFETLEIMSRNDDEGKAARTYMATNGGNSPAEYATQLRDTAMFYTPESSLHFANNGNLFGTMQKVRDFSNRIGVKNTDDIGILLPDGLTLGNIKNIKLRFDTHFVKLAVDRKL